MWYKLCASIGIDCKKVGTGIRYKPNTNRNFKEKQTIEVTFDNVVVINCFRKMWKEWTWTKNCICLLAEQSELLQYMTEERNTIMEIFVQHQLESEYVLCPTGLLF